MRIKTIPKEIKPLQELTLKDLVEIVRRQENCYFKGVGDGRVKIEVNDL